VWRSWRPIVEHFRPDCNALVAKSPFETRGPPVDLLFRDFPDAPPVRERLRVQGFGLEVSCRVLGPAAAAASRSSVVPVGALVGRRARGGSRDRDRDRPGVLPGRHASVPEPRRSSRPGLQRILDGVVAGPSRLAPGVTAYVSGPHGSWSGAAGVADTGMFPPGSVSHYSNIGYDILGLIAVRAGGKPLATLSASRSSSRSASTRPPTTRRGRSAARTPTATRSSPTARRPTRPTGTGASAPKAASSRTPRTPRPSSPR
jgi:hypothetical protein